MLIVLLSSLFCFNQLDSQHHSDDCVINNGRLFYNSLSHWFLLTLRSESILTQSSDTSSHSIPYTFISHLNLHVLNLTLTNFSTIHQFLTHYTPFLNSQVSLFQFQLLQFSTRETPSSLIQSIAISPIDHSYPISTFILSSTNMTFINNSAIHGDQ